MEQIIKPMNNEIWKDIDGFNGKYRISNKGRVWSCITNSLRKISLDKDGYCNVDNLEWCDCKYNINYGGRNKKVSEKLKNRIFSKETLEKLSKSHQVKIILNNEKEIKEFINKIDRLKKEGKSWKEIYKIIGSTSAWYVYKKWQKRNKL